MAHYSPPGHTFRTPTLLQLPPLDDCTLKNNTPQCINCQQNHATAYRGCPSRKTQVVHLQNKLGVKPRVPPTTPLPAKRPIQINTPSPSPVVNPWSKAAAADYPSLARDTHTIPEDSTQTTRSHQHETGNTRVKTGCQNPTGHPTAPPQGIKIIENHNTDQTRRLLHRDRHINRVRERAPLNLGTRSHSKSTHDLQPTQSNRTPSQPTGEQHLASHPERGQLSPAVACWASDHWVASSNPLRGKFRH